MTNPKNRFLLALPGAFGPTGGIEAYSRLVLKAFHDLASERCGDCLTHVLLDAPDQFDPRYLDPTLSKPLGFSGSRPRFFARTLERIARFQPDLVVFGHVNFAPLALAARTVAPRARQWSLIYGLEVWQPLGLTKRIAARSMDRTLSICDFSRRELVRHNGVAPTRVGLLPCALDPFWAESFACSETVTPPSEGQAIILTVGRLSATERHKGIDQVISALPRIAQAIPGVRYVVVGDGTDRPRLEQLALDLGVSKQVEFRGRVTPAELARAYAECSVFAMPSSQEGFGIVFLEAAHFGKPSIGGNHGGTPEVIANDETGRLVEHGNTEEFARVAIEMLGDPQLLREMGVRARRRLHERFTYPSLLANVRTEVDRTFATNA